LLKLARKEDILKEFPGEESMENKGENKVDRELNVQRVKQETTEALRYVSP
jgi:hypothetical protein